MDAREFVEMMAEMEHTLKPYKDDFVTYDHIPEVGLDKEEIIRLMEAFQAREAARWKEGFVSGGCITGMTST